MKPVVLAVALTGLISVTALAGNIPTSDVASPGNIPTSDSTSPGNIPTNDVVSPPPQSGATTSSVTLAEVVLTLVLLTSR
jgi:hypothetical protein